MRQNHFILSILITVIMLFSSALLVSAKGNKVDICHYDADSDSYHRITVSENATTAHQNHGDGMIGDPIPNMNGYQFDDNCSPEPITAPQTGCHDVSFIDKYIQSDGSNPQTSETGFVLFYDSACQYLSRVTLAGVALVWADSFDEANTICHSIGGNGTLPQDTSRLYLCTGMPTS